MSFSREDVKKAPPVADTILLDDLLREYKQIGDESFRRKYNHPFLLLLKGKREMVNTLELQTLDEAAGSMFAALGLGEDYGNIVVPLIRTHRHSLDSKITVGRARMNDVVIRSKWISKVHAAFEISPDGLRIVDMGSRNGTKLNNRPISKKNNPIRVSPGDVITFWRYSFEYLDTDALVTKLTSLKPAEGS